MQLGDALSSPLAARERLDSGIYYVMDTLKTKVCSKAAVRMMAFAEEHGILYRHFGKVIIAMEKQDLQEREG
jgi:L-2-hydroxyglutarate oxidase LhgO